MKNDNFFCKQNNGQSHKIAELQKQLEEQAQQIQALQNVLAEKLDKSGLIMVHSLEDEPLFKAFPLDD